MLIYPAMIAEGDNTLKLFYCTSFPLTSSHAGIMIVTSTVDVILLEVDSESFQELTASSQFSSRKPEKEIN